MIVLKILGFVILAVVLIITILLFLPIRLLIFTDKNNKVKIKFKYLWFTFGVNSKSGNNSILKEIKEALGLSKIDSAESIKDNAKRSGVSATAKQIIGIIKSFIDKTFWLLKHSKVQKLNINSVSAGEDAADAAMDYGLACAVIYPLISFIESSLNVKKNSINLDLRCDFDAKKSLFSLDIIFSITVIYVIIAFFRLLKDNVKREIN